MGIEGLTETWLTWFAALPPDCVNEWRYAEWRASYDEARGIARYFRYTAERRANSRARGPHGRI